jgi:hypothetical protein
VEPIILSKCWNLSLKPGFDTGSTMIKGDLSNGENVTTLAESGENMTCSYTVAGQSLALCNLSESHNEEGTNSMNRAVGVL